MNLLLKKEMPSDDDEDEEEDEETAGLTQVQKKVGQGDGLTQFQKKKVSQGDGRSHTGSKEGKARRRVAGLIEVQEKVVQGDGRSNSCSEEGGRLKKDDRLTQIEMKVSQVDGSLQIFNFFFPIQCQPYLFPRPITLRSCLWKRQRRINSWSRGRRSSR